MPNPFGITEVNLPQIYMAAQQAQEGRIRNMLLERQVQAADRQAERDNSIRGVLARHLGGQGGGSQPSAPQSQPRGVADVAQMFDTTGTAASMAQPPAQPAQPAQAPQQAAPRVNMREMFGQLIAAGMDPSEARQTAQMVAGADPQQLQMLQQRSQALASVLLSARRLPDMAQRRAFIQQAAPQLAEFGIDAAAIDPSDQFLDAQIALGTPIAQALEQSRPQLRNVGPGDVVIDVNNPGGPPVYESPFMRGPGGEVFARSQPVRVSTPEEARRLPPGTPIILPDGSAGVVPGGPQASSPAGGFP